MNALRSVYSAVRGIFSGSHDYQAAVRSLRRSPGFVAVAVLSLGIAIGVNGTTFAMLDAVLEPVVPYTNADRLVTVQSYGFAAGHVDVRPEMLRTFLARGDLFASVVPWSADTRDEGLNVGTQTGAARVTLVAPGLVHALGISLAAGPGFAPYAADEPAETPAIVDYLLWRQLLGGTRDLTNLRITIDGVEHPVVGVMPPGVDYPGGTEIWLRMPPAMAQSLTGPNRVQLLARLAPGVTRERAASVLDVYVAHVADENGLAHNMTAAMLDDLTPRTNGVFGYNAGIAVAALLVLIVACLNVANVMTARGLARRREIAVRVAIGASGSAIVRYVMAEAVLLAGAGGVLGVTMAAWGVDVVQARMPAAMARYFFRIPAFNWHVVVFVVVATGATALMCGLAPALRARRTDVGDAMKDGGYALAGRAASSYRIVVAAQLVLALLMAMAAAAPLQQLRPPPAQVSPIDEHNLYGGYVHPAVAFCRQTAHPERFESDLVATLAGVKGVRSAAGEAGARTIRGLIASDDPSGPVQVPLIAYTSVTPGYFRVRGVPIIAGRDFEPGDAEAGAAIVNLVVAKELWPFMSPVGRAVKLGPAASNAPWVRVIGVASAPIENEAGEHFDLAPPLAVVGHAGCSGVAYWARVDRDDPQTVNAIYQKLRAVVPGGSVSTVGGLSAGPTSVAYASAVIAFTYAGVALFTLLLAAAGVFGMMSLVVGQRRREFAVRVALGAGQRDIHRLVMREAWVMALAGIGVGALLPAHVSAWGGMYFTLFANHVIPLVVAEAAVVTATVLACWSPARRASRVDPVDVLRAS